MPHLIIEYSEEIAGRVDLDALVDAAHDGAMASGLFPEYDIKTRAIGFTRHRMGQTRDSFVHVSVHLLSGRDEAQKAALSETLLGTILPLVPQVVSVGVEIVDIHRASYRKRVLKAD